MKKIILAVLLASFSFSSFAIDQDFKNEMIECYDVSNLAKYTMELRFKVFNDLKKHLEYVYKNPPRGFDKNFLTNMTIQAYDDYFRLNKDDPWEATNEFGLIYFSNCIDIEVARREKKE